MKRVWLVSVFFLVLILAGCRHGDFAGPVTAEPIAVLQLVELAEEPAAHENKFVQVGGRYSQLPVPPCNDALYLPPASWSLSDGGVVIRAAGLENVTRSLALDGSILIVEGRWMRWHGPVGCGNTAVSSTIWYLDAVRILSPNPLVRGTATPSAVMADAGPAISPTAGPTADSPDLSPTLTPGTAAATPTRTVVASPTPFRTPTPTATGQFSPLPTPTDLTSPLGTPDGRLPTLYPPSSPTLNPSETVLPTFTPLADDTVTPTWTPDGSGVDQPTSTPSPTSTPTPSPTSQSTSSNQGYMVIDLVENGKLPVGGSQYWILTAGAGEVITITCGPAAGVDLELTVNDPQGTKIAGRDYAGAGGAETIPALVLELAGDYQILVEEVDGLGGDYGIVVMDSDSATFRFVGNLNYEDSRSTALPASTYHLWHFQGTAGDNVTVRLTPQDTSDLVFQFYGPDMASRIEYVDVGGSGAVEEADFLLTETGFYTIWVEEWDEAAASYELLLTDS